MRLNNKGEHMTDSNTTPKILQVIADQGIIYALADDANMYFWNLRHACWDLYENIQKPTEEVA